MPKKTKPCIEIDQEEFEKLCAIQTTLEELSAWFKCSVDTIERWCEKTYKMGFAEVYRQKRGTGKVSLRRAQFQNALKGNTVMQIWLGKQYLAQADKIEQKNIEEQQSFAAKLSDEELLELFKQRKAEK